MFLSTGPYSIYRAYVIPLDGRQPQECFDCWPDIRLFKLARPRGPNTIWNVILRVPLVERWTRYTSIGTSIANLLCGGLNVPWPFSIAISCHDDPRRNAASRGFISALFDELLQFPDPPRLSISQAFGVLLCPVP